MEITTPAVPASGTAVVNPTGQDINVALTGGTVQSAIITSPALAAVSTPAVPATTVSAPNNTGAGLAVTIGLNGATISAITINGNSVGTAAGTYYVPVGGTIAISYTIATPTWAWAPAVNGLNGTGASVLMQGGGSVTLWYSAAPTWAWTDPDQGEADEPQYAAEDTDLINEEAEIAAAHGEGGETGLGDAVSN